VVKHWTVSLIIHVVLAGLIVVAAASTTPKISEKITVVLNNEAFRIASGGTGGDGRTAGSQAGGRIPGPVVGKAKVRQAKALPGGGAPAGAEEQKSDKTAAASDESDLLVLGKVQPGNQEFEAGGASGPGEGPGGPGGGGTGIGGYGRGSGFGGDGKGGTGRGRGKGIGGAVREDYRARYVREHFQYIREMILKHLVYPPLAKKMRWQGDVIVSFIVTRNGCAEDIRIVKSSGYRILDTNVMETIKEIQPFPKPPVRAEIIIPVSYRLG
jgi:protein TonB